ncbi:hypothetical protein GGR88_001123 [Sphingomonas jejuensis]|uniref:PilZ domain-containing protein n=1 Tax=Sphingomonas jejuensis TaxID=904715 RepID=A0ABX0XK98_9SPHN|nr:PilZ domain-containing protein [Sphingomonas jejuensis]NJC33649.1 hypothetical protein [Sphingomonas jejuensis]
MNLRPREARRKVLIPSRMRLGADWVDVCIHNMSSFGMLVGGDDAPAAGSYVDIRRGTHVIIGRVVWRKDRFFGVRTQDRLDIDSIVNEPRLAKRPQAQQTPAERRTQSRLLAEAVIADRVEKSRKLSSALQFGLMVLAGLAVSAIAATEVYEVLAKPFASVGSAIGGGDR